MPDEFWVAIIALFGFVVVACITYLLERGAARAERARAHLAVGGDALEQFHWALKDALQFFPLDESKIGPQGKSEAKRVAELTMLLDASRAEASRQGTQLAIEFGKHSAVINTYDRRQDAYRRIMLEILGDRCLGLKPANEEVAKRLATSLAAFEGCADFIDVASDAAKARERYRSVKLVQPVVQEVRAAESSDREQKAYQALEETLNPETRRRSPIR